MHELISQAHEAAEREDWPAAITAAHEALKEAAAARRHVVNLARLVGEMSAADVGRLLTSERKPEGITPEAVSKLFGAKRTLASEAGRAQWRNDVDTAG